MNVKSNSWIPKMGDGSGIPFQIFDYFKWLCHHEGLHWLKQGFNNYLLEKLKFWSLERFRHSGVCFWCGLENQLTPTIWNTIQAQWNQKAFPNEKIFIDNISSGNFCLQGKSVCQLKNATWVNLTLELKLQKSVVKFIYLYFNTRSLPQQYLRLCVFTLGHHSWWFEYITNG